ncbi:MAG: hypothetical protein Q9224_004815 [Gallowayella concinna]
MSYFPGQQFGSGSRARSQSFGQIQSSSSRYPNSALRHDNPADNDPLRTPTMHHPGPFQQTSSFTPSPTSHRDRTEQSTHRVASSFSRHGSQQQVRYGEATAVPHDRDNEIRGASGMRRHGSQQQARYREATVMTSHAAEPRDRDEELRVLRRRCQDLETRLQWTVAQRENYVLERDSYQLLSEDRAKRIENLTKDNEDMTRQTEALTRRCNALDTELRETVDKLHRARATVKIQSEIIDGRATTDRNVNQAPPPAPPVDQYGQNFGFGIRPPVPRRPDPRPDPREKLYAPSQRRMPAPDTTPSSSTAGPEPNQSISTALTIRSQQPQQEINWSRLYSALFMNIEKYCRTYLNEPNEANDQQWPLTLGRSIVEESNASHVLQLAANKDTRFLLLTRIIVGWIDNHCFHTRIVKGFSAETDQKVQDLRRQPSPDNVNYDNIEYRRGLAQAEAATIEEITRTPGFDSWRTHQIREGVNTMMPRLTPAIGPGVRLAMLGEEFRSILEDGWRVGLKMATCTQQVDIKFPTAGPMTGFDPRRMLNRDPYIMGPPDELARQGVRVALGITPYITVKELLTAKMEERAVHHANVLLRY